MKVKLNLMMLVVFAIAVLSIAAFAEAPPLVNYQGRVLDAGGAPVPDGAHTFDFYIFDASLGGVVHWSSVGVPIVTTSGLFTYELGSSVPFLSSIDGPNMFVNNIDLWLEVVVDGVLQTPRTHLISNPFAETAGNVSYLSPYTGFKGWNTDPGFNSFHTYGADGLEQIRLWGAGYGEIYLHDGDLSNDITVILTANGSSGGELTLTDNAGVSTIDLHGGQTGNTSVEFPTGAIDADEMFNEPGIAHAFRFEGCTGNLASADSLVDSIVVNVPTSGYLYVTATGFFRVAHTSGAGDDVPRVWVDDSKAFTFNNFGIASVASSAPSYTYFIPWSISYVESVPSGQTIIYLSADDAGSEASTDIERTHLSAQFVPTSYGAVEATKIATSGGNTVDGRDVVPAEIYDASLEVIAEMEAEREALKAENERLRMEKEQLRESMQKVSSIAPGNQR